MKPAMFDKELLLHVCCASCMTVVHRELRAEGFGITTFFANPNIHPFAERRKRLESLECYADACNTRLIVDESYPLEENIRMLLEAQNRCFACFRDRLTTTAKKAAALGIPAFSTTLSVSPYQDRELLLEAGAQAEKDTGIRFICMDYRPLYRESVHLAREARLYRQSYCGCIFSERDRRLGKHGDAL